MLPFWVMGQRTGDSLYEAQLVSKPNRLLDHIVIKLNVA